MPKQINALPVCPYYKTCGGCAYQEVSYEEQLEKKQSWVEQLLNKYGKAEPIVGMNFPYYYRNKVHAVFGRRKDGTVVCGTYEEGTHHVIDILSCQIEDREADKIIRYVRDLLPQFHIQPYNEDTGRGQFRHVLIKRAAQTGEIMVVLVMADNMFAKKKMTEALLLQFPKIKTILLNINDRPTNRILGDKEEILFGSGYITDILMGCRFQISAKSFYQINPQQTKKLYRTALDYAGLTQDTTVLDAYSGIGTIGIIASKEAAQVTGVELNKDAVQDAIRNARENHIKNIAFYQGDAGEFLLAEAQDSRTYDVVIMDPPRTGSSEAFLSALLSVLPKKIVYISCHPQTLERDLEVLTTKYHVNKIQPVDMFPFSSHVEVVVMLSRAKGDERAL